MPFGEEDWSFTIDGDYSSDIPIEDGETNIETVDYTEPKWR